jgi:death-on-curing protein
LYPFPCAKAAALGESLIINHPFIDGNKRTGIIVMIAFLREFSLKVNANNESSTGEIKFDQIIEWLRINTQPV